MKCQLCSRKSKYNSIHKELCFPLCEYHYNSGHVKKEMFKEITI